MKRVKYLLIVILVISTAACGKTGGGATPAPDEIVTTITPAPTAAPTDTPDPLNTPEATGTPPTAPEPTPEETIDPSGYIQVELDSKGREFTLTDDERELFDRYTESLDYNVFAGADPISIAKIFVQCGIEGLWEAEYAMFSETGLSMTKHMYQEMHVADIMVAPLSSRKDFADVTLSRLADGVFREIDDNRGMITFLQFNDEEAIFRLVKNDDGLWMVKFDPIYPWDDELATDATE